MARSAPKLRRKCKQCGMLIEEPVANCPGCGRRVSFNTLDRRLPGKRMRTLIDDEKQVMTAPDADDGEPELTIEPPPVQEQAAELPPEVLAAIENAKAAEKSWNNKAPPPPVPTTITVGGIMLGTLTVAICMTVARQSIVWGAAMFMVLVPAYVRTVAAIGFFRKHDHELSWREVGEIFANSAVLGLMALPAPAFVFLVFNETVAAIVTNEATATTRRVVATAVSVGFAVWVTQRAWPVNER